MPKGCPFDFAFCRMFCYTGAIKQRRVTIDMALALSEEQLAKLNKKISCSFCLESMAQEKELRSQLAVLTDELKRTNQQMQVILEKWNLAQANRFGRSSEKMGYDTGTCQQLELAVMYAECFNEAEATVNGTPPDEPDMEEVTVTAHKRKKHAGKREKGSERPSSCRIGHFHPYRRRTSGTAGAWIPPAKR